MKKLACIALLLSAAVMAGCMYGKTNDCCGEYQANCCGWEFYKPCDLIEGKRADCCPDPCAGEVIIRRAPVIEDVTEEAIDDVMEEAPAAPAEPAAPAMPEGDPPAGG